MFQEGRMLWINSRGDTTNLLVCSLPLELAGHSTKVPTGARENTCHHPVVGCDTQSGVEKSSLHWFLMQKCGSVWIKKAVVVIATLLLPLFTSWHYLSVFTTKSWIEPLSLQKTRISPVLIQPAEGDSLWMFSKETGEISDLEICLARLLISFALNICNTSWTFLDEKELLFDDSLRRITNMRNMTLYFSTRPPTADQRGQCILSARASPWRSASNLDKRL